MSSNPCQSCGSPAQQSCVICGRCEKHTRRRLGDQTALHGELETAMTRQVRMQADNDGGRSANTPLVFAEDAAELLHEQRHLLASWCKLTHDEIDHIWPRRDTITAMALHLEDRMRELRKHPAAGELVSELWDLVDRINRCIDYPEDRHRAHIGACIITLEDGSQCPGQITLHLPTEGETYAKCPTCGTRWDGTQLNRLGKRLAAQAA